MAALVACRSTQQGVRCVHGVRTVCAWGVHSACMMAVHAACMGCVHAACMGCTRCTHHVLQACCLLHPAVLRAR